MILKPYVDALNENRFDPSQITSLGIFIAKCEGLSLFQHLGNKENGLELMNSTLLQFAKLLDKVEVVEVTQYVPVFHEMIIQMCLLMTKRETLERLMQIIESPDDYFYFLARDSKSTILRAVDYLAVRPSIPLSLRRLAKFAQVDRLLENCHTWEDLQGLEGKLQTLANANLFAAHTSYSGWALQGISQALRQISSAIPSYSTTSTQYFLNTITIIHQLNRDFDMLTLQEQKEQASWLVDWFSHAPNDLQVLMGEKLEQIILKSIPELNESILDASPQSFRFFLPYLSPEASLILLKALDSQFSTSENRAHFRNLLIRIEGATCPQNFILDFPENSNENGQLAYFRFANLLVFGNFPQVSHLTLGLPNTIIPFYALCALMNSPKIVIGSSQELGKSVIDYFLLVSLAACENKSYINFLNLPKSFHAQHDPIQFAQNAYAHGMTEVRVHSGLTAKSALPACLSYVKRHKKLPEGVSIYHVIPLDSGESFDLIVTAKGPKPGPLTQDMETAMKFFEDFNGSQSASTGSLSLRAANFTGGSPSSSNNERKEVLENDDRNDRFSLE